MPLSAIERKRLHRPRKSPKSAQATGKRAGAWAFLSSHLIPWLWGSTKLMCGIAGLLHTDGSPADVRVVHKMTDVIVHRGPDGSGFYVQGEAALGHRRLSIIDLATGGQPMSD